MAKVNHVCRECGDTIETKRWALGYKHCLFCGEEIAQQINRSRTIAPINKSNYMLITDRELLKQLNPKRTT